MCEQAPVHRFSPLLRADRLPASAHQHTRYKTLPAPPPAAQPVQNSPNTPKKALFSTFYPSRENFLPHPAPRRPAGRTLYRAQCQTRYKTPPTRPRQQPTRYKTLPAQPAHRLTRYKTPPTRPRQHPPGTKLSQRPVLQRFREKVRPAHLKTALFASFAPAGRIFSRSHPHQAEQGELIRAEDLTGRDDGATLKPPTPLFTVDRPRSSHRLYGRHPRPRTRAPDNECHHNETRIRLRRFNRRVGGTSALLMPPTRYVETDSRKAQASLGATSSSASPRWICPLATGVIAPNFFLFVTTTGVMVS